MFRIKCCGNCKHCRLDLKALNQGLLIDKCGVTGIFLKRNRWLSGFFCRKWRK